MSALLSVSITVKNPEKFKEYVSQVPATMATHGGEMLGRGKLSKVFAGAVEHQIEAFFKFPNHDAVDAWYNSDDYQALVELREQAADMNIAVLESF